MPGEGQEMRTRGEEWKGGAQLRNREVLEGLVVLQGPGHTPCDIISMVMQTPPWVTSFG